MTTLAQIAAPNSPVGVAGEFEFVTVTVANQLFGIPVPAVRDVLAPQPIAPIPLAPAWVAGALNLRGRIVTALDVRALLGLPPRADPLSAMSVVVEAPGEFYALRVDGVGDVLRCTAAEIRPNPPTLGALWRNVSAGVVRLDQGLLVVLDVDRLFGSARSEAA
jgi:purine-binding chemotaxis protein CheW